MSCTVIDCSAKVRARGLCSTHYNQQHQPQRHAKHEVPCAHCGLLCMKAPSTKFGARFCSLICRDAWRRGGFTSSTKADLAILRASQAWRDELHWHLQVDQVSARKSSRCTDCGAVFLRRRVDQAYCSERCVIKARNRRRRAREAGAPGTFTWAEVMALFLLFGRCCAYCEQPITGQPDPDHVIPLSRGGSNSITNILPTCHACNSAKRDMLLDEWTADRHRRGLSAVTTTWSVTDQRVAHLTSITTRTHRAA